MKLTATGILEAIGIHSSPPGEAMSCAELAGPVLADNSNRMLVIVDPVARGLCWMASVRHLTHDSQWRFDVPYSGYVIR